jgi:hypothetical protein
MDPNKYVEIKDPCKCLVPVGAGPEKKTQVSEQPAEE